MSTLLVCAGRHAAAGRRAWWACLTLPMMLLCAARPGSAQILGASVSPSSGTFSSGLPVTFTMYGADPADAWQSSNDYLILEISGTGIVWNNVCQVQYQAVTNVVFLTQDNGTTWISGTIGSPGVLSNSQCSVSLSGSTASHNGQGMTVTLPVTFSSSYTGAKAVYVGVYYSSNLTWYDLGTITITGPSSYLTTAVGPAGAGTISPSCPSGCLYSNGTQVTITAAPAGGYQFSGFTGTVGSSSNPILVTINGATTETANFVQTAPPAVTLLSPGNGATGQSTSPTLSWTTSSGATSYDVYLGSSSSPPFYGNTGSTSCTPSLSSGTQYWWKVIAKNSAGSAPPSAVWSFTTAATPPAVTLLSPGNGATGQSTSPALSWTTSSGATSYDLYLGTSSSPPLYANTGSTSYTPSLSSGTQYWWKVVAKNSAGSAPPSAVWSFTTAAVPPAVTLLSPGNGATGQSTSLTLSWTTSPGATSYDVYLGTSSSPPFYANTGSISYTPSLSSGTQYWWKVIARNVAGSSPASNTWNFTTGVPPSITSLSAYSGLVTSAVMISGANFGSSPGSSTVTFNGIPAPVIISSSSMSPLWTPTSIWVTVPNGATSGNVMVTVGGVPSNGAGFSVTVTPMGTSSYLQPNIGFLPINLYDTSHAATSFSSWACPPSSTVRGCFGTAGTPGILETLRAQGATGVRIFVTFCDANSQAFSPSCDPRQGTVTPNIGPGSTWIQNLTNFFTDVQSAGIQNVAITTGYSSPAAAYSVPKNQTHSPNSPTGAHCTDSNGGCCLDTPDPVYFNPVIPFGLNSAGDPVGKDDNAGYNCAPINDYFIGWSNLLSVVNAMLAAAQGRVTINELEFGQQEMDLFNFPAQYRYIYDSYPNDATPNGSTDVLKQLSLLMTNNRFDPGRVTWSAPFYSTNTNATWNCTNAWTDWARNTPLDEITSAINGGYIGSPDGYSADDSQGTNQGIPCGGTFTAVNIPVTPPVYHPQPDIVDAHVYPSLLGYGPEQNQPTPDQTQSVIQQIANLNYSDIPHLFALVPSLQGAQVILGETFAGTMYPGYDSPSSSHLCWPNAPTAAPAGNVQGFNQSALASYPVVLRPFMVLGDSVDFCYAYGAGPNSTYTYPSSQANFQNVNLNGQGPYVPTNH